jgi:hypothetical protein
MYRLFFATLFCAIAMNTSAQFSTSENENIVINKSRREYRFVEGTEDNPVQIKEKSNLTFYCNNYRAEVPVAEFYNDMERIDDVDIYVDDSKRHQVVPKHDYYSSEGIFYSDARVCYFSLPLLKKASTSKVSFNKTILDPKYFVSVHFLETQPIADQEIKIMVPSWMNVELKEFNFAGYNISKNVITNGDNKEYIYSMKNLPGLKREPSSPGISYYVPHILVMSKSAETSNGKVTYFNKLDDQYAWYRKLVLQIGNNQQEIKKLTSELINGLVTEQEKVKKIYQWVQDNIRYIAFENGIAGFKPEKAQDVLRKKYGDCKGMANLLTEMLRSAGVDARKCWIGTRDIAYDYSTPSLVVDNHMIAVWMKNGKPEYLDATEKYIGMGEVAERIQGKQTLIENGEKFILGRVPVASFHQNTDYEKRFLTMKGSNLVGRIEHLWKGENKVLLLTGLNSIKQEKQETALVNYLSEGKNNFEISGLKITNLNDYNENLKVDYDINWKNVVTEFGDEIYLEIDNRRRLENYKIDTATRKLPYWLDFKNHLVLETELILSNEINLTDLPAKLSIIRPGYTFTGNYLLNGNKLLYRCEIILSESQIKPDQFLQWNTDINRLKEFYNQQIVLKKIK